ncbi:MAG: HPr family phosphocarrier protein [Clostridia bacterium]
MVTKTVTITNQVGLHTRPATFFIQKANSFKCSVLIEKNERRANAKSLLGVLSLGISMDDVVSIITDGVDELEAADGLVDLIMNI